VILVDSSVWIDYFNGRETRETNAARARRLVREWARLHEEELLTNWKKLKALKPLQQIAPLE